MVCLGLMNVALLYCDCAVLYRRVWTAPLNDSGRSTGVER